MNKQLFFELYRTHLDKDKKLTQDEVNDLDIFLNLFLMNKDYFTIPQWAYVFASVFHETAHTFKPVIEAFWLSEEWRKKNLRYWPFIGRGYIQETWYENYLKNEKRTGIPFTKKPELALVPEHAFCNMIYNLKNGVYTGKRLDTYINESRKSYTYARYVVNGTDKRDLIASYAKTFELILNKSLIH